MKAAYCHPDEVRTAESVVRCSRDPDAVVKPHPWMRRGEVIICSPPDDLPPFSVAQRHMMEEAEKPGTTLADLMRMRDRLRIDYRLPLTS